MAPPDPLVFLVAGEPSGDLLGARLMAALRHETGGRVRFDGIGGPLMEAQGLPSRVPLAQLAVMGIAEVLPHIPRILRHVRDTAQAVRAIRPDVLVTIDAPSFTLRIARRLAGAGIPLVHFVAPTVWAWRPGRARRLARTVDALIALLPFEPPFFERHGLRTTAVGYPAIEDAAGGDGPAFRAAHGIPPEAPVLCAMPGSRRREIDRLLPIFERTVARLTGGFGGLRVVLPTVPNVAPLVAERTRSWPVPVTLVARSEERRHAFAASDVALVKSGTAAVELAAAGVPTVVTQRLAWTSALLFLLVSRVRYVSLVNLLRGREVQPERLQHRCRPAVLAEEIGRLLRDPAERAWRIEEGLAAARALGLGGTPPSVRAAREVLAVLGARPPEPPVLSSASAASAAPRDGGTPAPPRGSPGTPA